MEELAQQQTHIIGTLPKPIVHHLPLPSLPMHQPSTHQNSHSFVTQSGETKVKISSTTKKNIEG
jgi:hypothetical protein